MPVFTVCHVVGMITVPVFTVLPCCRCDHVPVFTVCHVVGMITVPVFTVCHVVGVTMCLCSLCAML